MKNKNAFLIYLIASMSIFLQPGCMTLKTIEGEELKKAGKIYLVALEDGTYYQIHANRQVKSVLEDDHLVLQRNKDKTNTRILGLEMMSGEMIGFNANEIIMSKQDKNTILFYLKDGSSRKFNMEDIWSIRIKQYETNKTIDNSIEWAFFALAVLWIN